MGLFPSCYRGIQHSLLWGLMLVPAISDGKMRGALKEGIRIPLQEKRVFDLWFQRSTVHHRGREVWQQVCVVGLAVSKLPDTK